LASTPLPGRESRSDGNSGTISLKVSFKRRRLLLQFNPDANGLEISDAESELGREQSPEVPLQVGVFQRYSNYVQLDHPLNGEIVGIRYSCNGHIYKSARLVTGPNSSNIIVLECVAKPCGNILAFLSRGAIFMFGQHEH